MLSTIAEILKGQRLGSGYKWLAGLVSRVCMAGLVFRVCMGVRIFRGSKYHVTGYSGCIGYLIKVAVLNKSYIPLQVRRDTQPGLVKMAAVVLARQDTPPGLVRMAVVVLAR